MPCWHLFLQYLACTHPSTQSLSTSSLAHPNTSQWVCNSLWLRVLLQLGIKLVIMWQQIVTTINYKLTYK